MSDKLPENTGVSNTADLDTPNANQWVEVTACDLPLHCPVPGNRLWDSHPKVYIAIEDGGQEQCPYCGTTYVFKATVPASH